MAQFIQVKPNEVINLDQVQEIIASSEKNEHGDPDNIRISFVSGKLLYLEGKDAAMFWDAIGRMPGPVLSQR